MTGTIFGLTEDQFSNLGLTYGLPILILYMMFIIGQLAWKSRAGRFGTMVMFIGLALGMFGFLIKYIIKWWIGIE